MMYGYIEETASTTAAASESIDIDWAIDTWCKLVEVRVTPDATLSADEALTVVLDSASGHDITLVDLNTNSTNITTAGKVWTFANSADAERPPVWLRPGDVIKVDYANSDDKGIVVTAIAVHNKVPC